MKIQYPASLVSVVLWMIITSAEMHRPLGGQETGFTQPTITATGTGLTTGHIVSITVKNENDFALEIVPQTFYIPSEGRYQSYVGHIHEDIVVPPGGTMVIPGEGYCADVTSPPVPDGMSMPPITEWIPVVTSWVRDTDWYGIGDKDGDGVPDQPIPGTTVIPVVLIGRPPVPGFDPKDIPDMINSPGFTNATGDRPVDWQGDVIITWPGTGVPVGGTIDPVYDPERIASIFVTALELIEDATEVILGSGDISPFATNPDREREAIIQQTFWIFTSGITGTQYTEDDFADIVYKQFADNTGIAVGTLPEEQKEELDAGIADFWDAFVAVGIHAKVLTPGPQDRTPGVEDLEEPPMPERHPRITETVPPKTPSAPPPETPPTTPPPPEYVNYCTVGLRVESGPKMDGGLSPPRDTLRIYRDAFIPLLAVGADYDELWWQCTPDPNCPETYSLDMRPLTGRVKFDWRIQQGEGHFVELGCLNPAIFMEGNRVIFMPPYVQLDSVKETQIKLRIIDDNPTQPLDDMVERIILIRTARKKNTPDEYDITISSDQYTLPHPSQYTGLPRGSCLTQGPAWSATTDLTTPTIVRPPVADNDKIVYREWIRLHATDVRDSDEAEVWCLTQCKTTPLKSVFEDNVEFEWAILSGGGSFIKGNRGRYVIYEAPDVTGEVILAVRVYNPEAFQIVDVQPPSDTIKLNVFQPGVRMDTTALAWLPEDGIELEKRSYLVYKENTTWLPALAHQCRIHFFEMLDVSKERGVCLNWPPYEAADTCRDLYIKKLAQYEVYDSTMCERWVRNSDNTRENTAYYLHARTKIPVREHTVTVVSDDYGGFGFIRTLANGDRSTELPYKSVEWRREEKRHPQGRPKRTVYGDSRVTIPRDIDENKIADRGWQPALGRWQVDPEDSTTDIDSSLNNTNHGDGIPAYEEYRGFFVQGRHRRFSPGIKDLLIWDRNNLGTGFFTRVRTGIQPWLVNETELDTTTARLRVINSNRGTHELGFAQKGVRLYRSDNMVDLLGIARNSVEAGADGLVTCDSVSINIALVDGTASAVRGNIIAHELSHAVSVRHHGEGIIQGSLEPDSTMTLDGANFVNNTINNLDYFIACTGGLTSGMENCWMRYDNYIGHCPLSAALQNANCANNGWNWALWGLNIQSVNDNVVGRTLCTNANGTGINAGNRCGRDASVGDCFGQIRISCRR